MRNKFFGPSTLVTAAFIGPGTITTCTLAGVNAGYALIWALVFSTVATIILQEMSARLGYVTGQGLGEALRLEFPTGLSRAMVLFLVVGAILIGNAAYEAGNIAGAVLGLDLIFMKLSFYPILLGTLAFVLLYFGGYKWIERFLIFLVLTMSLCFLLTALIIQPKWSDVFSGLAPSGISDHIFLIMGLIGTTIVPYNLFLHASTISKKWPKDSNLSDVRIENAVAILLGGLISILIVITAAASGLTDVENAADLAHQLEPLAGKYAKTLMGVGLLAAGLSSTLTAPLAAAYAAKGLFGWELEGKKTDGEDDVRFRSVWILILVLGILVSMLKVKPILIIQFAQITNALLLPFIAVYLVRISNSDRIMGKNKNSLLINVLSIVVIVTTIALSLKSLNSIFSFL